MDSNRTAALAAAVIKTLDDFFPADRDLVDEPVFFELAGKSGLRIRRIDYAPFQGFVETMQKAHKFQFDHDVFGENEKVKLLIPGVAKHLLVGWEDFPPEAPVQYSEAKAKELLAERKSFFVAVLGMAKQQKAFVRERQEAAAKNSQSGSPGSSSGVAG